MRGLLKQREALASGLCAVMRVMRSYFDCPSPEAALHPGSVAFQIWQSPLIFVTVHEGSTISRLTGTKVPIPSVLQSAQSIVV